MRTRDHDATRHGLRRARYVGGGAEIGATHGVIRHWRRNHAQIDDIDALCDEPIDEALRQFGRRRAGVAPDANTRPCFEMRDA